MTDTMKKMGRIKKMIGKDRLMDLLQFFRFIPDKPFLKIEYRFLTGKKLNLKNPETYNEKLQYLKLYDRKPVYTKMADKLAMREFVKERIGDGYTVPLLGVWDGPQDIDFDKLPDSFVLKCNHDSKGLIICRNKDALDKKQAVKTLSKSMKRNMFWAAREWPYKNIVSKVFAEELLAKPEEYQVLCFNGKPYLMYFLSDYDNPEDGNRHLTEDFFDTDFNALNVSFGYEKSSATIDKPAYFDRMIEISSILSEGIPHLRVDFIYSGGRLYVGELTFFNDAGFAPIKPEEWNCKLGSMIELPEIEQL